jgi:hypothetical protein
MNRRLFIKPNVQHSIHLLLQNSKRNAKKRFNKGRIDCGTFDLNFYTIISILSKQQYRCAYTNQPFDQNHKLLKMSIDRIDSSKGYTKDNIQIVHWGINRMKMDLSQQDFLHFIQLIYMNHN